jgi:hypothetical protein
MDPRFDSSAVLHLPKRAIKDWKGRTCLLRQMTHRIYDPNYYIMYVGQDGSRSSFVASVSSAALTRLTLSPLSRLSTLLSVNRLSHSVEGLPPRIFPALRVLYRTHGLRSFWRGSFLSMAKHGSALGSVHAYQRWKERLGYVGYSGSVMSGLLAGWISASVSYPLDVMKTRVMASVEVKPTPLLRRLSHGLTVSSLFRGYWIECMDMVPAIAIRCAVLMFFCSRFTWTHP